MSWKSSERLMGHHPALCPVSRHGRELAPDGAAPYSAPQQFLAEELPIRLAHRVQELDDLPDGLNEMPSVMKVKDWYAQSFELPRPNLSKDIRDRLMKPTKGNGRQIQRLSEATPNPSIDEGDSSGWGGLTNSNNGNGKAKSLSRRYFATVDDTGDWPADLQLYNQKFAQNPSHNKAETRWSCHHNGSRHLGVQAPTSANAN
ncbi:[Pyruvate dehydrogenase (acetyl-transferring)] kinase isozyme 2 [Metarhizium acridum]|nr:[Pyruvate dehydrogenase (acetyl-transferring)] kinase isozyme 2 [Metarhizium acridum]